MIRRIYFILAICLIASFSALYFKSPAPADKVSTEVPTSTPVVSISTLVVTTTAPPTEMPTSIATSTSAPIAYPENWQDLPVVPTLSPKALEIYQLGLSKGNNPNRFTKIGDGEISADWFLKTFDLEPTYYNLGEYKDLSNTLDYFSGSFKHTSQAAKRGYNTTKILSPKESDKTICLTDESPLDCEIRLYQPSFAIISMGTNQVWDSETFKPEFKIILDTLISNGIVPILSTKADNLEGDHRINKIITNYAKEYQLPVWNFWKICQDLPHQGMQEDLEHLTYINSHDFSDKYIFQYAWPNRNLSALQTLESVRQGVINVP